MTIRKSPHAFFVSENFIIAREIYLRELSTGQSPNYSWLLNIKPQIDHALLDEFDHRCAYCHSVVDVTGNGCVDHFYPKSIYPMLAFDWNNLLLSCHACNNAKGAHFPVDDENQPLLFNPCIDDYQEHFLLRDDGTLIGLTTKGTTSIAILKLNREALIEHRRQERLFKDLVESRPELTAALLDDSYYLRFNTSIDKIKALNAVTGLPTHCDESLRYMLYANIITCLETYLGDALISTVKSNRRLLRKFVETFHDFKEVKFCLSDVFTKYDAIDETAIREMADVLYHDLAKVINPNFYER